MIGRRCAKLSEKNMQQSKIKNISNNLLRLRTILILQKRKLARKEDSVQKYFAQVDFILYDDFISSLELEFSMYKYLSQNTIQK